MKKIPCEIYTRCVGYFRPVKNMNDGKKKEVETRKTFSESQSIKTGRGKPEIPDNHSMIVYSLPMCSGCIDLKSALKELGISFCERDGKEFSHELRQLDINLVSAVFPVVWDGEKVTQAATIYNIESIPPQALHGAREAYYEKRELEQGLLFSDFADF